MNKYIHIIIHKMLVLSKLLIIYGTCSHFFSLSVVLRFNYKKIEWQKKMRQHLYKRSEYGLYYFNIFFKQSFTFDSLFSASCCFGLSLPMLRAWKLDRFVGEKKRESFPVPRRPESHDEIGRVSRTRTHYSSESWPARSRYYVMQPVERLSLEKQAEIEEDANANYGREDVV